MPPRSKGSINPMKIDTTTSKKRPLSPNAPSSIARRPSTQGGFVISSDEDDESADNDKNDCDLVASKPVNQQAAVPSKAPASVQEPLPAEPTQGPFPTKQINKARLNKLLGRNGKLRQTTRKALPPSPATQSTQRSVDHAASNQLAESSKISQESTVSFEHSAQASLPQNLGKSLLGVKQTVAPRPKPPHVAISAAEPQNNFFQQHKSTHAPGNTAPIKAVDETKCRETALTVWPHVGVDKERGQQKFVPVLKPAAKQAPTKLQPDPRNATVQSKASPGANSGSKAQELSKTEPTILQSRYQHKENGPKSKQQASEVHSKCAGFTRPNSRSSEQPSQKNARDADNGTSDVTATVLQKPVQYLSSTPMTPKLEQENLKTKDTVTKGSEKASGAEAAKLSPPVASDVTPNQVTDASSEALVLPRCELSKDAQPYFEYSIFRKNWSNEQDENTVPAEEIIMHRFTNALEANTQAEKLFQSEKPGYMIVECSTKRDEHGCIVLTSSIAPFDYPTHKHYTKIYVRRDYVSKFANRTPQSLKGTAFISGNCYALRLFKLIEVSDAVNSDSNSDSDSDSNSPVSATGNFIRTYCSHGRSEVYTTLRAANRAARSLQVQLSHKKDPKDAMTKAFQEQDLKNLNAKVRELESAGDGEDRCWRSKFNASGLGGDKLELVVEKVGICGPRNI